ncbi:MAG: protein kinase, partial [Deltaproteobacteria bacterium]|nr:protein kinase [Deltaproteobacteria bacterium]
GVERLVVIKKVLPHLASEPGFVERFLDEMRVAAMLTHGNIVQVYEAGEQDGQYFMAMEYVDGMDLRRILALLKESVRTMPEDLALYLLTEAAKGLAYAHERCDSEGRRLNIVHRDVSPANLLVSMDGQVKLADFGVALATARLSLSVPGTLHGKVAYMSPEQVMGKECDARADVFGLGVVAYEMLTGKRPFDAETDVAVLEQVRQCEPVPICEAGPFVSASLGNIISRAMAREPVERYPSMDEFLRAMTEYMMLNQIAVSASSVAGFLRGLRPDPDDAPESGTREPRSLDDVAGELLDRKRAELDSAAAHHDVKPVAPKSPEPEWSLLQVVGAVLIIIVMGGGLWMLGRISGLSRGQNDAASSVTPVGLSGGAYSTDAAHDRSASKAGLPVGKAKLDGKAAQGKTDQGKMVQGKIDQGKAAGKKDPQAPAAVKARRIALTSVPEGAGVFSGNRRIGVTPLTVTLSGEGGRRLSIRKTGFEPLTVMLGSSTPSRLLINLKRQPHGRVKFRFFPASARVFMDGRSLEVKGNVVDVEVPAGVHEIEVRSRSGDMKKTEQVTVLSDKTAQLGTIELGFGVGGGE